MAGALLPSAIIAWALWGAGAAGQDAAAREPVASPAAARGATAPPSPIPDPPSGPPAGAGLLDRPAHTEWETFTTRDGLPSDEVFAIRIDGDRVWAGTREGLALYEAGRWRAFGVADGLPHPVVLALDVSPRTGDLWIGTMGGMARWSAGRIDAFTQMDSGLPNDFVHAVRCDPDEDTVWAATAMGAGRLDLRTGEWSIYTHLNTPMHEPWTYALGIGDGFVYVGAWGAGVLQYAKATGTWRPFRDPDKEFELDLLPDDGPVSDITSSADYADGLLWQSTYTGLSRYDGREWRTWYAEESGLASNFINFARARGRVAWLATDQGLSVTDGDDWVTYRRLEDGRQEILFFEEGRRAGRLVTKAGLAHNYVLGVDAEGPDLWVATGAGVSHGVRLAGGPGFAAARRAAPPTGPAGAVAEGPNKDARYARTPEPLEPYRGMAPHRRNFTERSAFRGAGRDEPEPRGLSEVRIGFIGPLARQENDPLEGKLLYGRRMLRAATLAVEEANREGGHRGTPFALVTRSDLVLWGQTSNELVSFVRDDGVWAVLSSIDSNHNHVLSRTALKTEVPVVTAGSTDPTLVEHSIPWLVRLMADDRQLGYALLHELFRERGRTRVALLRVNDRDGRVGVGELVDGARRLGHPIVIEQRFLPGQTDFAEPVEKIREANPDAIVLWGDVAETAAAVRTIREAGIGLPLYGYDRMAQDEFLKRAGPAAEGIVLAVTMNPRSEDPDWTRFRRLYAARWKEEPDTFAAHAYEGIRMIVSAIRKTGLNRARIRDELFALSGWTGATGEIVFDTNMSNVGPTWLAVARDGRFEYAPAQTWEEPESPAISRSPGGRQP